MNTETSPETFDPRAAATAWALDELTPEERAAFEQKAGNDAGLAALAEETKEFCGLLAGSLGHPTLELQEAARGRLLQEANRTQCEIKVARGKWIRRLTTMAACVAAGGAGTYWWLQPKRSYSYHPVNEVASTSDRRNAETGVNVSGHSRSESALRPVTDDAMKNQVAAVEKSRQDMLEVMKKHNIVDYTPLATGASKTNPATEGGNQKEYAVAKDNYEKQLVALNSMREHTMRIEAPDDASQSQLAQTTTGPANESTRSDPAAAIASASKDNRTWDYNSASASSGTRETPRLAPTAGVEVASEAPPQVAATGTVRGAQGPGNKPVEYPPPQIPQTFGGSGGLVSDGLSAGNTFPVTPAAPAKPASTSPLQSVSTGSLAKAAGLADSYDLKAGENSFAYVEEKTTKDRSRPESETDTVQGGESYDKVDENPFRSATKEPLSTFSIDVDTASYSNVRRFLNMGQCPPPAAVRLEELVNYFPYDYAPPQDGKPFAVHVEMTSAPWDGTHRLARIALKGKEVAQGERPAVNLVFLVDVSGSMNEENKLPLVKKSLKLAVERLTEKDTVSLVTYAGESGVVLPATNGRERERIMAAIDGLNAGGSTNGAGGISMAYAQVAKHFNREGVNRVILATDGDFNVGPTSHNELLELITQKAKSGTFLSVLGYGMGNTKDNRMEMLADKGNGNYAYIDSLSEARKTLADQLNSTLVTIAKDVKIQIEFNPAIIRSYRLLGYENRMLAKEDFNNDQKDAGEIGAGHTVTALYELIPAGVPDRPVTTEKLKYQPRPEPVTAPAPAPDVAASGETMTVNLRWKAPDGDVSQLMEVPVKDTGAKISEASPETRWAVAVAGFASLLNNSRHAGLSWEDVRALAKGSKGADPNGYRGEFLQLVDKAESVRGK